MSTMTSHHNGSSDSAQLLPHPPDIELDVPITVLESGTTMGVYHSFTKALCVLDWGATMSQARVVPITVAARAELCSNGHTSSLGAVPITLSGQVLLYNPNTQTLGPVVPMRAERSSSGWITFDPRSLVTSAFPWVYGMGLTAMASRVYGVGPTRHMARTTVSIGGYIGYIN